MQPEATTIAQIGEDSTAHPVVLSSSGRHYFARCTECDWRQQTATADHVMQLGFAHHRRATEETGHRPPMPSPDMTAGDGDQVPDDASHSISPPEETS